MHVRRVYGLVDSNQTRDWACWSAVLSFMCCGSYGCTSCLSFLFVCCLGLDIPLFGRPVSDHAIGVIFQYIEAHSDQRPVLTVFPPAHCAPGFYRAGDGEGAPCTMTMVLTCDRSHCRPINGICQPIKNSSRNVGSKLSHSNSDRSGKALQVLSNKLSGGRQSSDLIHPFCSAVEGYENQSGY